MAYATGGRSEPSQFPDRDVTTNVSQPLEPRSPHPTIGTRLAGVGGTIESVARCDDMKESVVCVRVRLDTGARLVMWVRRTDDGSWQRAPAPRSAPGPSDGH
jgi:hypothetical protein